MKESDVEDYFIKQWEAIGGVTRKVKFIGRRDCPDRFATVVGWTGLVELKRPSKKPRATQQHEFDILRKAGANVVVINTFDKVNMFIAKVKRLKKKAENAAEAEKFLA